jgi:hypothetical protein
LVSSNVRRDRLKFSPVKIRAPEANEPAMAVKPSPRGVPRLLQRRRRGRADVMTREQVRERHEQSTHDRHRMPAGKAAQRFNMRKR